MVYCMGSLHMFWKLKLCLDWTALGYFFSSLRMTRNKNKNKVPIRKYSIILPVLQSNKGIRIPLRILLLSNKKCRDKKEQTINWTKLKITEISLPRILIENLIRPFPLYWSSEGLSALVILRQTSTAILWPPLESTLTVRFWQITKNRRLQLFVDSHINLNESFWTEFDVFMDFRSKNRIIKTVRTTDHDF